jgi:Ala-tRNA(Pro) deacylase
MNIFDSMGSARVESAPGRLQVARGHRTPNVEDTTMVPDEIHSYLRGHGIPYRVRQHPFAIDSAHLAAAQHISGWQLAKPVILKVDGGRLMVVVRGPDRVDLERASAALGGRHVELCPESEFAPVFPGCELGAEPPFGGQFGMPVYVDQALASLPPDVHLVLRAGSHTETIEMALSDFLRLEKPRVIDVGRAWQPPPVRPPSAELEDEDLHPYHGLEEEGAPVG